MDINDIRIIITVVSFLIFIAILAWAWSNRQRERFREAANLPFADSDTPQQAANTGECYQTTAQQRVHS